jgi:copper(I)-binding protein
VVGRAFAATALLLTPLAGCGAGQLAHTAQIESVVDGTTARIGDISILDAQFLFTGPIPGDEVYQVGTNAPLHLTIVNSGDTPDRLIRVTSPIAASGVVLGPTTVSANGSLTAGQVGPVAGIELPDEDEAIIGLVELSTPIRSGLTYPVVFEFERAGQIAIPVPVDTPDLPRLVPFDAD